MTKIGIIAENPEKIDLNMFNISGAGRKLLMISVTDGKVTNIAGFRAANK